MVEVVIDDGAWQGEVGEPARTAFGNGSRLGVCMRMILQGGWETMFIEVLLTVEFGGRCLS